MLELNKEYPLRGGGIGIIYRNDGADSYPLIGAVLIDGQDGWRAGSWSKEGRWWSSATRHSNDIAIQVVMCPIIIPVCAKGVVITHGGMNPIKFAYHSDGLKTVDEWIAELQSAKCYAKEGDNYS